MLFEWSEKKSKANLIKHKISFELAAFIFQDHNTLNIFDSSSSYQEERWQAIGAAENIVLFVVHTIGETENGEEIIRIISARKATAREKQRYYAHQKTTCAINES